MEQRDEFVNRTQGYVGAIRINRKGDEESFAIAPGERCFLSQDEQELTARAHRRKQDSPFVEREIVHFDPMTHEEIARFVAPLLEKVVPEPAKPRRRRTSTTTPARRKATTAAAT